MADEERFELGSFFSGIGGLDHGFERAGFQIAWQVEKSSFCRRVLRRHGPGRRILSDVRDCDGNNLEPVTGTAGGFPCQDISEANRNRAKKNRIAGSRSCLGFEYLRVIEELHARSALRFALFENVPALLRHGLDQLLTGLAKIRFDAEWDHLSAAAVGAPHIRDRFFVFAYPHRERRQAGNVDRLLFNEEFAQRAEAVRSAGWTPEPGLVRVVHGVCDQAQRIRGLGNAVVPAVGEVIATGILKLLKCGEI